jgi:hypothetical protein
MISFAHWLEFFMEIIKFIIWNCEGMTMQYLGDLEKRKVEIYDELDVNYFEFVRMVNSFWIYLFLIFLILSPQEYVSWKNEGRRSFLSIS